MERIKRVEELTAILEAIKDYNYYLTCSKARHQRNTRLGLGTNWIDHNIDIQTRVINRLETRYLNSLNKLNNGY